MSAVLTGLYTRSSPIQEALRNQLGGARVSADFINNVFKRKFESFAKTYVNNEPEILCACEYYVGDKLFGSLLIWEKFFDSTHYEVFKRNLFISDSKFERVLFLDAVSLEGEKQHYINYLKDTVGLNFDFQNILVFFDPVIKPDRVYEYKILASRVPKDANEVEFDMILESRNLVRKSVVDSTSQNTIFDTSAAIFGSRDLAWILGILNEDSVFFGKLGVRSPLARFYGTKEDGSESEIISPFDINDVLKIIHEAISLFGYSATLDRIITEIDGLTLDFKAAALASLDEARGVFSYDTFRETIKKTSPIFNIVIQVSESGDRAQALSALSKISIIIPQNSGTEELSSVDGLTKIFKFINEIYLSTQLAQDKDIFDELNKIRTNLLTTVVDKIPDAVAATYEAITGSPPPGIEDNNVKPLSFPEPPPTTETTTASLAASAPSAAPAKVSPVLSTIVSAVTVATTAPAPADRASGTTASVTTSDTTEVSSLPIRSTPTTTTVLSSTSTLRSVRVV